MDLNPGLSATVVHVVGDDDTSASIGASDVAALATPRLISLAEQAIWAVLDGRLDTGWTAVEHRVEISHISPTAVGSSCCVSALLELVEIPRLTFRISVTDERGLVASGRFTRVLISHERFGERLAASRV